MINTIEDKTEIIALLKEIIKKTDNDINSRLQMEKGVSEEDSGGETKQRTGIEKWLLDLQEGLGKDLEIINKGEIRNVEILYLANKYLDQIGLKISRLKQKWQEDPSDLNAEEEINQWTDWLNRLEYLRDPIQKELREGSESTPR